MKGFTLWNFIHCNCYYSINAEHISSGSHHSSSTVYIRLHQLTKKVQFYFDLLPIAWSIC